MRRLMLALPAFAILFLGADARAQEAAKVQITIKIAKETPSFKDQRLVVMLYHNHPRQTDRADSVTDSYIDRKFTHEKGKETVVTFTLGQKTTIKRDVRYGVTAYVFDGASKRTHVGKVGADDAGPFGVLTNGNPSKLTIQLTPAKGPVFPPSRG